MTWRQMVMSGLFCSFSVQARYLKKDDNNRHSRASFEEKVNVGNERVWECWL